MLSPIISAVATHAGGLVSAVAERYGAAIRVVVMCGRKQNLAARSGSVSRGAMIEGIRGAIIGMRPFVRVAD